MFRINVIIITVFLTVAVSLFSVAAATLKCYQGAISSRSTTLNNGTCDHTLTHTLPILGDGNTTEIQYNYSLHDPETSNHPDIRFCMILKHSNEETTDYHCDYMYQYICNKTTPTTNTFLGVTIKGVTGTLHCCTSNLCNSKQTGDTLSDVTANLIQCYLGNSSNNVVNQCTGVQRCVHSTVYYASTSLGGTVTPYSCDTDNICDSNGIQDGQCQNVTEPGLKRKVCCCSKDLCNDDGIHPGSLTKSPVNTVPNQPLSPMPSHLPPGQSAAKKHWMFFGGITAGIMFGVLVFIVVAVVIRRYKQQQEALLTYSYTQLTADLAEHETNDERMLIG